MEGQAAGMGPQSEQGTCGQERRRRKVGLESAGGQGGDKRLYNTPPPPSVLYVLDSPPCVILPVLIGS